MVHEHPLVSIIVPVYNAKKDIDSCIESLVRQTYGNLQIILVDDGSTDGSGESCEKWSQIDRRITTVHKKNQGASSARNAGLKKAAGDYVMFVDADDYAYGNMIKKMVRVVMQNDKIDIVTSDMTKLTQKQKLVPIISNWMYDTILSSKELVGELVKEFRRSIGGSACALLVKCSIARSTSFDTGMRVHEDQKWLFEIFKKCRFGMHMRERLYVYRDNGGSASKKYRKTDIEDKQKIDDLVNDYAKNVDRTLAPYATEHSFLIGFDKYKCGVYSKVDDSILRLLRRSLTKKFKELAPNQRKKMNRAKYLLSNSPVCIFTVAIALEQVIRGRV